MVVAQSALDRLDWLIYYGPYALGAILVIQVLTAVGLWVHAGRQRQRVEHLHDTLANLEEDLLGGPRG